MCRCFTKPTLARLDWSFWLVLWILMVLLPVDVTISFPNSRNWRLMCVTLPALWASQPMRVHAAKRAKPGAAEFIGGSLFLVTLVQSQFVSKEKHFRHGNKSRVCSVLGSRSSPRGT